MPGCSMYIRPKLAEKDTYNSLTQNIVNNNSNNHLLFLKNFVIMRKFFFFFFSTVCQGKAIWPITKPRQRKN